ncbi:hypothetical protein [Dysgonomonas termitidis]|uniref:Fimbrillin family protein n=1 Tax=Dysgonomonas termitidis TaxID=1516126 RepID=A0ABV9KV34_9BACT
MKKVIFVALILIINLWSCSQSDETETTSDDYVNVTIGSESRSLKSIIEPGGTTTWNIDDEVKIIDVDGAPRTFTYGGTTAQRSAEFKGTLKAGQGKKIYRAYHVSTKSNCVLQDGHILAVERENLNITEDLLNLSSAYFGTYCPMIAIPVEFNAENPDDPKLFQFHHLTSMIEARVSLRETEDEEFLNKICDKVVFEIKAVNSKPFYTKVEFDLNLLGTNSNVEDLNECIINMDDESGKVDFMSTTVNINERTIRELMQENAGLKSFPIPIFAFPTNDSFEYIATVYFYYQENIQLQMEGSQVATGLNPVGLNVLGFDYKKIVR